MQRSGFTAAIATGASASCTPLRTGNAYTAGDGTQIPAAYTNEDLFAQFGFSLDVDRRVEFRYLRQDQTDTQYPAQFWQTDAAVTQGFNLQYVDQSLDGPWTRLVTEGWYNIGRLFGSTNPNENTFQVVQRVNTALTNAGAAAQPRLFRHYERQHDFYWRTLGHGLWGRGRAPAYRRNRFSLRQPVRQRKPDLQRHYDRTARHRHRPTAIVHDRPRRVCRGSRSGVVLLDRDPLCSGGLDPHEPRRPAAARLSQPARPRPGQNNVLYSFFLTNEVELDKDWTVRFGFGQAQRPPTMTERYADGEFLAVIQSGFSRVIGLPTLMPERAWQLS